MKQYLEIHHPMLFLFFRKTRKKQKKIFQIFKNWWYVRKSSVLNKSRFLLVVSRYNENISWVNDARYPYRIFNKGKNDLPDCFGTVSILQNLGRESSTYLDFIIENYDQLPEYTVFLQGYPFDHASNLFKKLNAFDGRAGFCNLSDVLLSCDDKGLPHPTIIDMATTAEFLFGEHIPSFVFGPGAQFVVDRNTLRAHTKETYVEINRHCKQATTLSDLCSPWILERMWQILFDEKKQTVFDRKSLE